MFPQSTAAAPLRLRDLEQGDNPRGWWDRTDLLVLPGQKPDSRYLTGFACSERCVESALRLRFQVFNLELQEGLAASYATGLDRDHFDAQMTHLVLIERTTGEMIGTYRMQTMQQANTAGGLYSAQEFDLSPMRPYFPRAVELGRACVAKAHRSFAAITQLWAGIAAFLTMHDQVYVFGCCSITTQDPDDGWRAMKTLRAQSSLHPELRIRPADGHSCGPAERADDPDLGPALKLPKLFKAYLRLGATVISEPAIDRAFGTVDFLVLLDARKVNMSSMDLVKG